MEAELFQTPSSRTPVHFHGATGRPMRIYPAKKAVWKKQGREACMEPKYLSTMNWLSISLEWSISYLYSNLISHTIHVWYIYIYIYHKHQPNVGKYTIHGFYGYYNQFQYLSTTYYGTHKQLYIKIPNPWMAYPPGLLTYPIDCGTFVEDDFPNFPR